ncbi:MAG: nucleotide exchange factor GrpE [Desulfobacterales bacterium]|nr:nucleotide exchange factor GrpE [Desulfobacterales bacterium]MDX2509099.1 nucleotide exchange factor GrpE [Desulfobacterales bacterium]
MAAKRKIKIETEPEETTDKDRVVEKNNSGEEIKDAAGDPLKGIQVELETAKQEAKETHDRFLRVSAEFENYKKRSTREMDDFRKYSNQSLIKEMLAVVDNLERALNSSNGNSSIDKCMADGVNLTLKEILKVFEKFNVKPIESIGQPFDPTFHQAMMQEETDEHPENTIITELQKGYMIHDRLLRPSMVVVAAPKAKT